MPPRQTVERELKLRAGEGFALPELGGEPLESRIFVSTYFDSADHRLAQAGVTLRHRVEHGLGRWQLKLPHGAARLELEVEGGPAAVPDELGALLVAHLRGRPLVPVARLRTRRDGVRADGAEIVHDSGAVLDAQRVAWSFDELEVELVEGDERALKRIEKALRRAGAVDGEQRPKVMQALDLEYASDAVDVAPGGGAGAHLAAALRTQFMRLLGHDPGTRLGTDPEDLHQLRVATRRLRAFLRAGRPLLDAAWADDLRARLGEVGRALGPARDLDVLIEHLEPQVEALGRPDLRSGRRLLTALRGERRRAGRAVARALEAPSYLELVEQLDLDTAEPPLVESGVNLRDIWAAEHRKLRRAVEALPGVPSDDELHAIRIRVKRARYAAELAGFDGYVEAAKRAQDALGDHQDAVVAEERLRALAERTPQTSLAAGRLIELQRIRREAGRAAWPKTWRRLRREAKLV